MKKLCERFTENYEIFRNEQKMQPSTTLNLLELHHKTASHH